MDHESRSILQVQGQLCSKVFAGFGIDLSCKPLDAPTHFRGHFEAHDIHYLKHGFGENLQNFQVCVTLRWRKMVL